MWEFNVLATMASGGRFRHMMDDLKPFGEFHRTEFNGVALGRVENLTEMLETVREQRRKLYFAFQDLGRVIPFERCLTFEVEKITEQLKEVVLPFLERLAERSFYVRMERRGHKGELISPEIERELDAFLMEKLKMRNMPGRIDFDDPDAVIALETVGDRCGVGLLSREMLERYDFVRVE